MMTRIKTESEIMAMRESGRMLSTVLGKLKKDICVGMTTKELADIAKNELKKLGGKPAFLGYKGFPDVLCVSINDEIIHGIPSQHTVIHDGDIVSMDFGVNYKGMITDAAITTIVGSHHSKDRLLVDATRHSLDEAIAILKDGVHIGDLSSKIQQVLEKYNLGIVKEYVGHGVGHQLHEEPNIPNYGVAGSGMVLKSGMTIAIEPMATLGSADTVVKDDGWTVVSRDGSRSAHFEHTILVTDTGCDVLTA